MHRLLLVVGLAACGDLSADPSMPDPDPQPDPTPTDPPVTPFAYPRGCFTVSAATGGPISDRILANPGLVGIGVSIEWRELETAGDNQFDWAPMDARVAEAKAAGKSVVLSIVASAAKPPAWLLAMPEVTKIQMPDPNPNHGTGVITVVPYWDPIFRAQKLELIRAAGDHFAADPAVVGVFSAFANYYTNDWGIPPEMVDDNYSYAGMLEIGEEVLTTTASAFPNQAIKLPLGKNDPSTDPDKHTTQMSDDIVAFAQASPFADRFFGQKNLISAQSPLASEPGLGDDPDSNDYLLKQLRDLAPNMGLQMLASATGGEGDGCRQNGHQSPCPPHDVLAQSIDISLTYQPTFLEFWTGDAANPELYDLFTSATTSIKEQP